MRQSRLRRILSFLRYPSLVFVLLAILLALPGTPNERLSRLAAFTLLGLAAGEVLVTALLLYRGAQRAVALAHLLLGLGALLAGLSGRAINRDIGPVGMTLMLLALVLLGRLTTKSTVQPTDRD